MSASKSFINLHGPLRKRPPVRRVQFLDEQDETLLHILARAEFNISGLKNKHIRFHLEDRSSAFVPRLLKRLRSHGLIKKVGRTYKYYLTRLGKQVVTTALKLRELFIIPQLAFSPSR